MLGQKRSQWIWLGLIGAGTGLQLVHAHTSAPDNAVSGNLFTNANSCIASGKYSVETCNHAFDDARQKYQQTAPRYLDRAACEADFAAGGCASLPQSDGAAASAAGTKWAPIMAGALLATGATAAFAPSALPVYQPCSTDPNRQDCRTQSGGSGSGAYYTSSGYRVSSRGTSAWVSRGAFSGNSSAVTLARGGFGARAASVSARG